MRRTRYPGLVPRPLSGSQLALAVLSAICFLVAVFLSWTRGADRLTVQLLAMGLGLLACLFAALAAGWRLRRRRS